MSQAKAINTVSESIYYHPQADEVEMFTHAWQQQLPVLLKGPTGCGKTRFVEHMAEKLGRKIYTVACHEDLTAADIIGRHLIGDNGTYWQDGPLTKAVREGAICYLDEVIEARKDTIVVTHPITDNRRILPIDRISEQLVAPPEFMLVVSYNPGYQNLLKGMKPSTRQRFISLRFDYPDIASEIEIVMKESGCKHSVAADLVVLGGHLRKLKDYDLEESVSTRLLIYTATMINSGVDPLSAYRAALAEPLSDDQETVEGLLRVIKAKLESCNEHQK